MLYNSFILATSDDYGSNQLTITISPGMRNTTVILAITDDDMLELEETFNVTLIIPENVTSKSIYPGSVTSAVVTITDNDG